MLVKNWMSKKVITIEAKDSMQRALSLMKEHKIRMLPVLQRGKLVGVVSDNDLKRASASDATMLDVHEMLYLISKIKVKDIMVKDPLTVAPDCTVEETAELLMDSIRVSNRGPCRIDQRTYRCHSRPRGQDCQHPQQL